MKKHYGIVLVLAVLVIGATACAPAPTPVPPAPAPTNVPATLPSVPTSAPSISVPTKVPATPQSATVGGTTRLDVAVGTPPAVGWGWSMGRQTVDDQEVTEPMNDHSFAWVFYVIKGSADIGTADGGSKTT